jgi:hypothetical protein
LSLKEVEESSSESIGAGMERKWCFCITFWWPSICWCGRELLGFLQLLAS